MIERLTTRIPLCAIALALALGPVTPVTADDVETLDRELLDALEGRAPADSLEQIVPRLIDGTRTAARRIGQGRLDDETATLQEQILADIDALLEQSARGQPPQSRPSASLPSAQSRASQSAQSQQQQSQQDSSDQPGGQSNPDAPSRESTERSARAGETESERQDPLDLSTAAWGHLPPKVREQLRSAFSEEYLPEYDAFVRRYYEALARRREVGGRSER